MGQEWRKFVRNFHGNEFCVHSWIQHCYDWQRLNMASITSLWLPSVMMLSKPIKRRNNIHQKRRNIPQFPGFMMTNIMFTSNPFTKVRNNKKECLISSQTQLLTLWDTVLMLIYATYFRGSILQLNILLLCTVYLCRQTHKEKETFIYCRVFYL